MEQTALMSAMKDSISETFEKMFYMPLDFLDQGIKGADSLNAL